MESKRRNVLLVVDGGTTNLRVSLLESVSFKILDSRKAEGGVKYTAEDGHNGRLKSLLHSAIGDLLEKHSLVEADVTHCIAYGMITSGLGLIEIPHRIAPVSEAELRAGMVTRIFSEIASFPIEFIPGVRNFAGAVDESNCGGMDMMRGEETEAEGLYRLLELRGRPAVFVLPGSHNKFVRMGAGGEILSCLTSISGELLDAITHHTILTDAVKGGFCTEETCDPAMVRAGARECAAMGLGRAAFAGRILSTLGNAEPAKVQSWLLGAALAEDAKALRIFADGDSCPVFVAGKPPLQRAFLDVLEELSVAGAAGVEPALSVRMGITGALAVSGLLESRDSAQIP